MKTKSVTLRLPIDLLEAIEKKSGKNNRSGFIIQALRESLGVEENQLSIYPQVTTQITELIDQFEIFKTQVKTQVEGIVNRVEKLEEPQKISDTSKTDSKTDSKTKDVEDKLNPNELDEIPDKARLVDGSEMLKILKREDLAGRWDNQKLRAKRRGNPSKKWHTAGECKFIYKGPGPGTGNHSTHEWWAITSLVDSIERL